MLLQRPVTGQSPHPFKLCLLCLLIPRPGAICVTTASTSFRHSYPSFCCQLEESLPAQTSQTRYATLLSLEPYLIPNLTADVHTSEEITEVSLAGVRS